MAIRWSEKSRNQHPTLRLGAGSGIAVLTHLLLFAFGPAIVTLPVHAFDCHGNQFIPFKDFSSFAQSPGEHTNEVVLLPPQIMAGINWDELIVSWNAKLSDSSYLKLEARAIYQDHATKYYTMACWSGNPTRNPRESTPHQKDADGDVSTDTLILKKPCDRFQIKLTTGGESGQLPGLKFLGLCLTDTKAVVSTLLPNRHAWGQVLPVPERSQMVYPNGKELCSPTTVSMLMSYWSARLERPELDHDVPEIVKEVYDAKWEGTGNWPFNTAYAGSYPGMCAYVTRMSDISELEDWIAAGMPVGVSLCYNKLRGKAGPPSGHLVVCVGFTKDGDVVLNDPGTTLNVRKTFFRKNFIAAWANSRNAVYLIYPESAKVPEDRFGHWDSRISSEGLKMGKSRD